MRRRVPLGGLVALAAVVGIAAMPAVSSSANAKKPHWLCPLHAPTCATVVVHVYFKAASRPRHKAEVRLLERFLLHVGQQGEKCGTQSTDASRCFYTKNDTLGLAPGSYEVAAVETNRARTQSRAYDSKVVTVDAGQTLEVTLDIQSK